MLANEISHSPYPLISVVIPAYNSEKTLINTLSSVIGQTYVNFEVLIVDDGSDISVEQFVRSYIKDKRIRIYRTKRSNANIARNFGIQKSEGEYIAMLDADDCWLNNHLEDCLACLQKTKAEGLYGSLFMNSGEKENEKRQIMYARELKKGETIVDYLLTSGCGAQTSTLFTKAYAMKQILWDSTLIDHQDYDFVARFYKKYKMSVKKEPSVIYSLTSGRKPHFETCIKFVEQNLDEINPAIYAQYNKKMYFFAIRNNASEKEVVYFRKEALKFKEYLSYRHYLLIKKPQTYIQKVFDKIVFLFYIFRQ